VQYGDENDTGAIAADRLVHAVSNPLRIQLLQQLENRAASKSTLQRALGDLPLKVVSYHVDILLDSGCVVPVEDAPAGDLDERLYRAAPGVFLDPLYRAHADLVEADEAILIKWREITVDRVGRDQIVDLLRGTRLQLEAIEEQSRGRMAMTAEPGTRLVTGVVAFESER
jgi:DNA-binding transcriptional ArsR family regulator